MLALIVPAPTELEVVLAFDPRKILFRIRHNCVQRAAIIAFNVVHEPSARDVGKTNFAERIRQPVAPREILTGWPCHGLRTLPRAVHDRFDVKLGREQMRPTQAACDAFHRQIGNVGFIVQCRRTVIACCAEEVGAVFAAIDFEPAAVFVAEAVVKANRVLIVATIGQPIGGDRRSVVRCHQGIDGRVIWQRCDRKDRSCQRADAADRDDIVREGITHRNLAIVDGLNARRRGIIKGDGAT